MDIEANVRELALRARAASAKLAVTTGEERKRALAEPSDFAIDCLEVTALAISSSDLRARVAQGRSIRY